MVKKCKCSEKMGLTTILMATWDCRGIFLKMIEHEVINQPFAQRFSIYRIYLFKGGPSSSILFPAE